MIEYHPECLFQDNHRFALEQKGNNVLIVIGVNPSTADQNKCDPTMGRVLCFVNTYNYDGFVMLNLSSERATRPSQLSLALDLNMHKENMDIIEKMGNKYPTADILLAFGNNIERRKYLRECFKEIYTRLEKHKRWLCIGGKMGMTKLGHPRHPLYSSTERGLGEMDIDDYITRNK